MNGLSREAVWRSAFIIGSELIFILFPVGLTGLVVAMRPNEGWSDFFRSPEWSFAATILAGQTGVKMFFGMARAKGLRPGHVGFIGTVLFLMSSAAMAILVFLMLFEKDPKSVPPPIPHWPVVTQVTFFFVGACAFFFFGTLAHLWLHHD